MKDDDQNKVSSSLKYWDINELIIILIMDAQWHKTYL